MTAEPIATERLNLEPLRVEHAQEMVDVLADSALYGFTGGSAPTVSELRNRYAAQVAGPGEAGEEAWLNWIVRSSGQAAGFVQATVDGDSAAVAWLVGTGFQGRGLAGEAVEAMAAWLRSQGVAHLRADIHPGHAASAAVAARIGLAPTDEVVDGEIRWRG